MSQKNIEKQPKKVKGQEIDFRTLIQDAQRAWAEGVVSIGKTNDTEQYIEEANRVLDELYDFDKNDFILFKPTLASQHPVRTDRQGTASYFIGGIFTEDGAGFARTPWARVTFEDDFNFTELDSGDILVMGRCTFYPYDGDTDHEITTADYTFGYRGGSMRIFLHHSSNMVSRKRQVKFELRRFV